MSNKLQKTKYTVSESDFENAVTRLSKYNQGIPLLNQSSANYSYGIKYTETFEKLRIQNSRFDYCTFEAAFNRTNLSGSKFKSCAMDEIGIENSSFQFSNFKKCSINNCRIEGSNFSNCFLDNITFTKNNFLGNNFSRSHFYKCKIKDGELLSSTFEFSIFTDTTFENLRLANLSMEYSEFENVHMNNVILPFAQLPFIFNGLDYIIHTNDDVAVSANMEGCQSISIAEYLETLKDWKIFFLQKSLYFPLTNILLAEGKTEEALECILSGILLCMNRSDYRTLKYLCKLISSHQYVSKMDCLKLYERIKELSTVNLKDDEQKYHYTIHMQDIKSILVENPKYNPQLSISVQTNILPENRNFFMHIVEFFDSLISKEFLNIDSKTVSIKHNSPYEIIILVIGSIIILKEATELVKTIISGVKISTEDILSIRSICKYKTESDRLDLEIKKASLDKERLEAEKLRLEIEKFQKEISDTQVEFQVTHNIQEVNKIYIA